MTWPRYTISRRQQSLYSNSGILNLASPEDLHYSILLKFTNKIETNDKFRKARRNSKWKSRNLRARWRITNMIGTMGLVKPWNVLASTQEAPRAVSEQVLLLSWMSSGWQNRPFLCPTLWKFSVSWHPKITNLAPRRRKSTKDKTLLRTQDDVWWECINLIIWWEK